MMDQTRVKPTVSPEDIKRVKALGFLWDKRSEDCFNARVITRNGKITAEQAQTIAEAAKLYGSGEITLTVRMTMEIQHISYANIEPLRDYLAARGMQTGGTGARIRPVACCKGTTCQYGLIDTFAISEEIHKRFFEGMHEIQLPHKFKIAVGGCPNNCVKPDLNDIGIIGQRVPRVELEKCRGCKVCQIEKNCPMGAATLNGEKVAIDQEICNHCGRCYQKCPFKAFENPQNGYRIYLGGRWGKKAAVGRPLTPVFTSPEEVYKIMERAILLYRDEGINGERFADTLGRLGFESVEARLLSDD